MKFESAALRSAAVLAVLVVSGCFSQPKNNASASPVGDGSGAASGSGAAAASTDPQDWSHTVDKPVTDPALNMTAFTVHVPAGWKFTGMIERIGGCHGTLVPADGLAFTALAPDGVTAIGENAGHELGMVERWDKRRESEVRAGQDRHGGGIPVEYRDPQHAARCEEYCDRSLHAGDEAAGGRDQSTGPGPGTARYEGVGGCGARPPAVQP